MRWLYYVVGACSPIGGHRTIRFLPLFVLPDRGTGFDRVDRVARCFECLGTMRSADDGDDRTLAELEASDTVQDRYSPSLGPPRTEFIDDGRETALNLFLIGLVREVLHTRAFAAGIVGGVVTNDPAEQHDCTSVRQHTPLVRIGNR